jgi:uncharacterized protein YdaU (DUF1376 family)
MAALPYMPLFVADYLADTAHLTTQQHGAYLLLIMNYWQRSGPLPDDDSRLSKIARVGPREWIRMRPVISEFFSIADGTWLHSRIASELARVEGGKADPEAEFWANAKTYLKRHMKGDPGALISKWLREQGKPTTMAALNAAQMERAVNPLEYIPGYFRRHGKVQSYDRDRITV